MRVEHDFDTDELLRLAETGQPDAMEMLFERHRDKLRRMVEIRLEPRLRKRFAPSDVVQDSLAAGLRKWKEYLRDRPLPFYAWLRQLTAERLATLRRQHVGSLRRSINREQPDHFPMSDESLSPLVQKLASRNPSPGERVQSEEIRTRVRHALEALAELDREVIVLRHLEQLSVLETAQILQVAEGTVKSRHYRALKRLKALLGDLAGDAS